MKQVYRWYQ